MLVEAYKTEYPHHLFVNPLYINMDLDIYTNFLLSVRWRASGRVRPDQ